MSNQTICPRCESAKTNVLTESPVPDVWDVFQCETCFFVWRSTEPDFITNPSKYNQEFKLTREQLDRADIMPSVPALKALSEAKP